MPTVAPSFHKAKRRQCKASIVIEGISGRGKSGLALAIAYILAGGDWDLVYGLDTENQSLVLYSGLTLHTGVVVPEEWNVGDLTKDDGYMPSNYTAFRDLAIAKGAKSYIQDSISHMWQYKGGVLDMVSAAQLANPKLNKYTVWGTPEVMQEKNMIQDLIRSPKMHVISTVRAKEKQEIVDGDDGKKKVQSLGEQQIMMPDLKFEPDLVLSMQVPGSDTGTPPLVKITKSRYAIFKVDEEYSVTAKRIEELREYLEVGTSPEELLAQQHKDYTEAITAYLDNHAAARNIWAALKQQQGVEKLPLEEISLPILKRLFGQLAGDGD